MWQLIQANRRKSILLFVFLTSCLLVLGYAIGMALFPTVDGGIRGVIVALCVSVVMSGVAVLAGDMILLKLSYAREITHDVHPQLFNIAEEMRIASCLPVMPRLYLIYNHAPNAFATGVTLRDSSIVVTSGLLTKLNRDELQGVIAHEMSHILNRDVQFMTLAGVMLGSITLISEVFLRGMFYSSRASSRRYSRGGGRVSAGGGQIQAVMVVVALVFAVLAPILAQIFYFAISRKREYLADATAVRLSRYPEGLARALEKISRDPAELTAGNKITAPMYIINPLEKHWETINNEWASTHPPTQERIKILRGMMHGVNYRDYQAAYDHVQGSSSMLIPDSELREKDIVGIRPPYEDDQPAKTVKEQLREMGDLTRAVNGFMFTTCVCGLKVKVPPDFMKDEITCPRCGALIALPVAALVAMNVMANTVRTASAVTEEKKVGGPQVFGRKTNGWESLRCQCGQLMQISPQFAGTHMKCYKCRSTIKIQPVH